MTDLLHQADHAGIARAAMLRAIRERAAKGDLIALGDISQALEDLDRVVAEGDWFGMVRRAFWLAARAEGGTPSERAVWHSAPEAQSTTGN
jgi:hypothetical protein